MHLFRITAASAWMALAVWPVVAAAQTQNARIVEIKPAGQVFDWACDEATGRVFASQFDGSKVVEMDPATGKQLRAFDVGNKPTYLLIKDRKLVAACEGGVSLYVIDLKTNTVDGRVQLSGKGPYALACSKADNPWVYAIANTGSAWWDGELFQVDVVERKVRNQVKVQGWRQSHVLHIAMTPDGSQIVVDARGASSPSRADVVYVDEEEFTFKPGLGYHSSFGQIVAGPYGRFWTLGGALYSRDIKQRLREFKGSPARIHPTLDLVASVSGATRYSRRDKEGPTIHFQAFSNATVLGQVALPVPPPEDSDRRAIDDPELVFDAGRQRLFFGYGPSACVVDMTSTGIEAGPLLLLTVPAAMAVDLGDTLRMKLTVSDPKLAASTTFSLENGPKGMRIANGEAVWKPQTDDVGRHTVTVKAERGKSSDSATVTLDVTRRSLDLGGPIQELFVDRSGERALALIASPEDTDRRARPPSARPSAAPQQLLVVDLAKMKVTARRQLEEDVVAIGMKGGSAFTAPRNVTRLTRYKVEDLSEDGKIYTDEAVMRIEPLPDGDLLLRLKGTVQRFDGQKPREAPLLARMNRHSMGYGGPATPDAVQPVPGGIAIGSIVLDAKTHDPCFVCSMPDVPSIDSDQKRGSISPAGLWNRSISQQRLMGPNNTVISPLARGATLLLSKHPLAVTANFRREGDETLWTLQLDFRDLLEGRRKEPLNIMQTSTHQDDRFSPNAGILLQELGDKLLVGAEGRLFLVQVPADRLADLPVPLYFVQRISPLALPVRDVVTIKPSIVGGAGKTTFELPGQVQGVAVDPKSGALTFDTKKIWQAYLRDLGAPRRSPYALRAETSDAAEKARAQVREILGIDPKDAYPLAVHFRVVAKDAENQRAELSGCVILLGDAEQVDAEVKKLTPTPPPAVSGRPVDDDSAKLRDLQRQIEELKKRNQQLEAQVQLLKDLLREGNSGPKPKS